MKCCLFLFCVLRRGIGLFHRMFVRDILCSSVTATLNFFTRKSYYVFVEYSIGWKDYCLILLFGKKYIRIIEYFQSVLILMALTVIKRWQKMFVCDAMFWSHILTSWWANCILLTVWNRFQSHLCMLWILVAYLKNSQRYV